MAKSDHDARWYANVNDDARHHLIERGWFGQDTQDPAMRRDVDRTIAATSQRQASPDAAMADQSVEAADLYGHNPEQDDGSSDFYGYETEEDVEASDLYGTDPHQDTEAADFYGHQDPDIEQEY